MDVAVAQIAVTPAAGLTTSNGGVPATFTVVLTSKPTATVTIPVSSSNLAEGTSDTSSLVFTPNDWSVFQTVTVTGAENDANTGNVPYSVTVGPAASSDPT